MAIARIILKEGRERSLYYRHPWVFSGGIDMKNSELPAEAGGLVDICDHGGKFLARGYYNPNTNIAARVLTFKEDEIDTAFFEKRFRQAWELRKPHFEGTGTNAYRLVFAEGDMLPGLVVDNYDGWLVVQVHTAGMEKLMPTAVEAMVKVFSPKLIYEKSTVPARKEEGLDSDHKKIWHGHFIEDGQVSCFLNKESVVKIEESGIEFSVDVAEGQKTGFFLDQRENRLACMPYFKDRKVLNLFSYTGGFSCYAAKAGAAHVTSVDISKDAVAACRFNMELNGNDPEKHEAVEADAFEFLEKEQARGMRYEVVVVDPPAFVKSKKNLDAALKAYARVNELALKVLAPHGVLITSSCSGHVTQDMFKQSIFQAALRAGADLVIAKTLGQPVDHPNRIYFPEGSYLKFFILQKRG
jgi:23S rRNA (cytosine1962-C5)-methyltransferase